MTRALHFVREHYLLVPAGAVAAVVAANAAPEVYFRIAQPLAFPVNDVGMAFVLAFIARDLFEAMLQGGSLHPPRRAALPLVAGVAGAIGAVATYTLFISRGDTPNLMPGWRAATAVDIGLCYATATAITAQAPAGQRRCRKVPYRCRPPRRGLRLACSRAAVDRLL